jgi:hypothetical protein
MDTDGRFPTPTTRRTVVTTGAKLAYAAPLVAASFKVSALNVAATHSPGHTCCLQACGQPPDVEPPFDVCGCVTGSAGTAFCSNNFFCFTTPECTVDADCPAGWICQNPPFGSVEPDCGGNCGSVCTPPCGVVVPETGRGADGRPTNLG